MVNSKPANILFIMCDQLRWDYLSCSGHPTLETPHIDLLAQEGVKFGRAFCQAPICGPSRASFYTGRYMSSHGSMANDDPLKASELTLGDYMRPLGYRTALVGKTHTSVSATGLARLGIEPESKEALALACGGFEPFEAHEGLYPDPILPDRLGYTDYLRQHGFVGTNPWQTFANNNRGESGESLNGWLLRNNGFPSEIPEEHSETAFVTNRAIDFIREADPNKPWCLHLSYIKPHWPLVAPAPYHQLYDSGQVVAAVRSEKEKTNRHPVVEAFAQQEYSVSYAKDPVRNLVIPVYMGLIKQIDDHLGRLFVFLREKKLWDNTIIVFTSDHGDYLGDHWLGEKDLFHDCSSRIPLLIRDPRDQADSTRGSVVDAFVESVDLLPTFIDIGGGKPCIERLEGRSLMSYLHRNAKQDALNPSGDDRAYTVSEIDYSDRGPRTLLDVPPYSCRAYMLRTHEYKFIFYEGFRPQLFDLVNDPDELVDLGEDKDFDQQRHVMHEELYCWLRHRKVRTEMPYHKLDAMGPELDEAHGIIIGRW